jgi:hypothetical protein
VTEYTDVIEPDIEIKFKGWKENQKELIEFILQFSNLNLDQLAEVIEEDPENLNHVIKGKSSLKKQSVINLNQLVYMFSCSCDLEQ